MIRKFIQRIGTKKTAETSIPSDPALEIDTIENKIGYKFQNKNLLVQAFKHRSFLILNNEDSNQSNERLEFLGDAVLDLIVTDHLYKKFKKESEGTLSKKKSVLVSRQVLAGLTNSTGLGNYLLVNKGEEKTGGRKRQSNLANLFEAILGAIYLDGGVTSATGFVERFLISRREEFLARASYFNYKSSLLEYSQAKGWGVPSYRTVEELGPDHDKQFKVVVTVDNFWIAEGSGKNKKKAEQMAAKNVLNKIKSGNSENAALTEREIHG